MIAGLVISEQWPPTAKGMGFIVLEDETGRVQVALPPQLAETLRPALVESRILAVGGRVERSAGHVTLLAGRLQPYTSRHAADANTAQVGQPAPNPAAQRTGG